MSAATPVTDATPDHRGRRGVWIVRAFDWVFPVACVALMAYFAIVTQSFLTPANLSAMLVQNATVFVVAAVAGVLLMAGYVDLSVGSTMAVAGVCAGLAFVNWGVGAGVAVGLAVGLGAGLFNGLLIGRLGLSPIVVTLGGLAGGRALALFLAPDSIFGFPEPVIGFANTSVLGVSAIGWVAIIVAALTLFVMGALPFGRHVQAIGVNPRAAFLVGIRVKSTVVLLYAAVGLAVGIAALLQISRLDSAPSGTLGVGFEVTVLTAILLGGVPFTGGRGSLWRVLVGVWLLAVLRNGLTLLNYGPEAAGVLTGLVLIVAAALQALSLWVRKKY
ncbi:ABC transporter permease [Herbiconiux sp. YIM B11900]|uniref:ABC transporter permease n=1 Tax=Herbiconiux sp. YIM B11900 TaxID=3404131 RepID=UPI003F82E26E